MNQTSQSPEKWSISLHWLTIISVIYLALPCMLFFCSWFSPWVSWPINLGIIWSIVSLSRTKEETITWIPEIKDYILLILAGIISFLVFICSGLAGYIESAPDVLIFREALYNNLLREEWPLILPNGKEMSYYLAGMLPPALMGRLFEDYTTQRLIAAAWYALGIWLAIVLFYCRHRSGSILFLVFMVFFKDPAYLIINSFAGNGEIWNTLMHTLGVNIENNYIGAAHPVKMLSINAQGCNFQPFSLLCAAILINCRKQQLLIPLSIALILPSSPLGAVACMPLALYYWIKAGKILQPATFTKLTLPVLIALFCAIYYGRANSATCAGIYAILLNNWEYFLFNYYSTILLSALLFACVLKPVLKSDPALSISLICTVVTPWLFYGSDPESGMFGQNELWLKASIIYHMHLIAALCFNWEKLPRLKYLYLLTLALLVSRDERVRDFKYTGTPQVSDVWGGHLNHEHVSLYQKIPDCNPPLIPGCMMEKGEAEHVFPGNMLPKAPGGDYTKPATPDGVFVTY